MNLSFFDSLRPYISRGIAGIVGAGAGLFSTKTGITLTADQQLAIALGVSNVVYGAVHKVLDKSINPGDAASTHLVVSEKIESADLKG